MAGTTVDEGGLVYRVLDETVAEIAGCDVPGDLLRRWKGTSKREAIQGLLIGMGAPPCDDDVEKAFHEFNARLFTAYRTAHLLPSLATVTDLL